MRIIHLLHNGGDEDDDDLPGQPWEPQEPHPDGEMPSGGGTHRKDN